MVKDIDKKEYVDFNRQNSRFVVVGHGHPRYNEIIKEQADWLIYSLTGLMHTPRVYLAEKLGKLALQIPRPCP